ncbi:MAG: hypothetical protein AAF414_22905 [Pseudomonadota bacterium]
MKKLVVALAMVIVCGMSASASAQQRTDRMTGLMALVPANWLTDFSALISFADVEASTAATVRSPAGLLAGLMGRNNPQAPLNRLRTVPFFLSSAIQQGARGGWQERVGFEPDQISALLTAEWLGDGVNEAMVFDLTDAADHNGIGQALLANDYQARTVGDWSAWWRGEDYDIDRDARDPVSPFGGGIGQSSRVASDGESLVHAAAWAPIEEMAGPPAATLRDQPEMTAIVAALNDPRFGDAQLVQATVLPEEAQAENAADDPVMPPWRLGMLADLSTGPVDYGVMAVVFDDRATAEGLADPLLNAWQTMRSTEDNATFAELTGGEAETFVVGDSPAALVLSIERSMDGEDQEARNLAFHALFGSYIRSDLSLLATQ